MKINSKIISEKVDHFIDLLWESDECPDTNDIPNGEEPEEGKTEYDKILKDIEEEFELGDDKVNQTDECDDLKENDDIEEGIFSSLSPAARKAARIAKAKELVKGAQRVGSKLNAMGWKPKV